MPGKAQRLINCCSQRRRKRRWVTSSLPTTRRTRCAAEQKRYGKITSMMSRSRSETTPRLGSVGLTNFENVWLGIRKAGAPCEKAVAPKRQTAVAKLYQNPSFLQLRDLPSSEEQIPQVVENI